MRAGATATLLAACVAQAPVSPAAGPGSGPADPRTAAEIFNAACIQTLPDFAGTAAALAAFPMVQNADTGTYFHTTQNLSVKLTGGDCSIVFALAGDAADGIVAFGTVLNTLAPSPDITVTLDGVPGPDGLFYANARTSSSSQ